MPRKSKLKSRKLEELTSIWKILTKEEKEILRQNYDVKEFKKGDIIYQEGEKPTYLMCVVEGQVKIFRNGFGGREQIVRIITPVSYFGYRAHLAKEDYVTSAVVQCRTVIFFIPLKSFDIILNQNIKFSQTFLKFLAADLGIADFRVANLVQKHVRGRLAESILFLKDNYGCEADGATLVVSMTREDLSGLSNMTTANGIRTLSQFVSEGIVEVNKRKIKILDEEKLLNISHFG